MSVYSAIQTWQKWSLHCTSAHVRSILSMRMRKNVLAVLVILLCTRTFTYKKLHPHDIYTQIGICKEWNINGEVEVEVTMSLDNVGDRLPFAREILECLGRQDCVWRMWMISTNRTHGFWTKTDRKRILAVSQSSARCLSLSSTALHQKLAK